MCLSDETKFTKYIFFLVFIDQYDYILDIIDRRIGDFKNSSLNPESFPESCVLGRRHSGLKSLQIYRTNTTSPVSVFFSPLSVRIVRM